MYKKVLRSLMGMSIILTNLMFMLTAQAEIETYEGHGEFLRTDETMEYAKQEAKLEAERDISRQVYIHIKQHSQSTDSVLDYDEIVAETENIIRIIDVKYHLVPEKETFIVRAIIKAEVDTDELAKLYNEK